MKKIEAFIRPEKLDAVVFALEQAGYGGISISEVRGHGKQRGVKTEWHGQYEPHTFQSKLKLEIYVHDMDVNPAIHAITQASRTQKFGDGKIFVLEVLDAVRVRTEQRGEIALD